MKTNTHIKKKEKNICKLEYLIIIFDFLYIEFINKCYTNASVYDKLFSGYDIMVNYITGIFHIYTEYIPGYTAYMPPPWLAVNTLKRRYSENVRYILSVYTYTKTIYRNDIQRIVTWAY